MSSHTRRLRSAFVLALVVTLALTTVVFSAATAKADHNTIPWSSGGTVPASGAGLENGWTRVLTDQSGNVYVFYETTTNTNQANVSVAKYNFLGSVGLLVYQYTRSVNNGDMSLAYGTFVSVAIDPSGNLYCAWTKAAGYTSGHGDEVYVSMSADGGNTWAQVARASSPSGFGDDANPSLAVNPVDGTVWVAWDQAWDGEYNVTISHSTNQGASFTGVTNITNQGTVYTIWPQLGVDSHGRLYVVYEFFSASAVTFALNWTWSEGGSAWAASQTFTSAVDGSFTPTLVVDASNHIHVAWYDARRSLGGTFTVRYRMSADRGSTWTADLPVSQGTIDPGNYPALAVHGSTVIVFWHSANPGAGVGFAISADGGLSFYPEEFSENSVTTTGTSGLASDANGTFYASFTQLTATHSIGIKFWVGPPSTPAISSVTPGTSSLTVAWSSVLEKNVAAYRVYRSTDGSNYELIASVSASTTSYADTGLTNGTYWYRIDAVNLEGTPSHQSTPWSGTVGPTTQQLIASLQSQIANLQAALNTANANLTSLRSQLTTLQNQLSSLQNSQASSNAATAAELSRLQANITAIKNELNNLQSQQATQTISYANLAFEIIVVVLLVVLLLNQMRRPRYPQMMMAQPAQPVQPPPLPQVEPRKPEDDL
jgi:hypothetical protein